jgi:hypothetical protein
MQRNKQWPCLPKRSIDIADPKTRCLGLIGKATQGGVGHLVLCPRDRAVAAIVPPCRGSSARVQRRL